MQDSKCAFSAPLISADYGCRRAIAVTRRGGPEIACADAAAAARCAGLFDALKATALPAFGVADDLLEMPHSVTVKIQYGGLAGLARVCAAGPVTDIDRLLQDAVDRYGSIEAIPCAELARDITDHSLRRRRGRD